jgi:PBP1b-binding outer membrane lipoprotein LpoB
MKNTTKVFMLAIPALLLAGCSKPTGAANPADVRLAADMNLITNVIMKKSPIYKQAELGSDANMKINIGTNSDQRHYVATWNGSTWKIAPTNQ